MPRASGDVSVAPANRKELQRFVWEYFGIHVPGRPLCAGHDAPLDYLTASFLHQQDLLVWANRGAARRTWPPSRRSWTPSFTGRSARWFWAAASISLTASPRTSAACWRPTPACWTGG